MLVVAYASLFGWVVTVDDLVGQYSSALLAISDNPWIILLVIMIILLVTGMFMDAVTIMFITLPIFLPVARELGWDPVWFGVLVMIKPGDRAVHAARRHQSLCGGEHHEAAAGAHRPGRPALPADEHHRAGHHRAVSSALQFFWSTHCR